MVRTPTHPPTHPGMWRRLVSRAHPDTGGDHDLFIWTLATRDAICGGELGPEIPRRERRGRTSTGYGAADRIRFDASADFDALTRRALVVAEEVGEPYAPLLRLLNDCGAERPDEPTLGDQQRRGATYKSLAAVAHRAGMTKTERVQWYRICEQIPLAQRHAGHLMMKLQREAA